MSLLDSVLNAENTRTNVGVSVLKKAQNVETQQGEAAVALMESAGSPPAKQPSLDVFA